MLTEGEKRVLFWSILWNIVVFCILGSFIFVGYKLSLRYTEARIFQRYPDYGDLVRFDLRREGGHLYPNLNLWVKGEKARRRPVRFITNSKGFRNEQEFAYAVPKDTFRILFSGDSFVDGFRTDQYGTMGAILESSLKGAGPGEAYNDVEVMVSGHGNPTLSWYHYQEHGWKYHPDLVIIGVTLGNDLVGSYYEVRVAPTTDTESHLRLLPISNSTSKRGDYLLFPDEAYVPKKAFREFFQDLELRLCYYLAKRSWRFANSVPPSFNDDPETDRPPKRRQAFADGFHLSLGLFYQPLLPEIEAMYANFEKILVGLNQCVKQHGSQLLMVLFPVRIQASKKDWHLLKTFYSLDENAFDLAYPNRRILGFCEEQGIACLDLLPAFTEKMKQNDASLYQARGDMHFNDKGQKLAGYVIGENVLKIIKSW